MAQHLSRQHRRDAAGDLKAHRQRQACSLHPNNADNGQGVERRSYHPADQKKKHTISFLADKIPNVRSLFHIDGKRYLCERLIR